MSEFVGVLAMSRLFPRPSACVVYLEKGHGLWPASHAILERLNDRSMASEKESEVLKRCGPVPAVGDSLAAGASFLGAWRHSTRREPSKPSIGSLSTPYRPLSAVMATVYEQLYTNATVLVTDFIKSTQENDVASLYAGVDLARLNWLEQAWVRWYQYIGNTTVATGIMSFVLHEVSHWLEAWCHDRGRTSSLSARIEPLSGGTIC